MTDEVKKLFDALAGLEEENLPEEKSRRLTASIVSLLQQENITYRQAHLILHASLKLLDALQDALAL